MNTNDPRFELIRRCHDGEASAEELAQLEGLLRDDAGLRNAYVRYINLDAALGAVAKAMPASASSVSFPRRSIWLSWHPLASAAAGLAIGLFCASMVWAYVPLAKGNTERTVTILSEGFENSELKPSGRFPKRANEWSGDLSAPAGVVADVKPAQGNHMMPLIPVPQRKFSYARWIVDLAEHPEAAAARSLRLDVAASFNTAESARPARYQIRLAAFSEAPSEVRDIWNNEPLLSDTVLQHVGRNVRTQPGEAGWKMVQATIQIPPGTRSILISLAAGEVDPAQTQGVHYLDEVNARFVITQEPAE